MFETDRMQWNNDKKNQQPTNKINTKMYKTSMVKI